MRHAKGFTVVEIVVVVVAVGLMVAGGYLYYSKMKTPSPVATGSQSVANTSSQPAQASASTTPATITSNAGLDAATNDLDQTNVDSSLDSSLNQLNNDSTGF